MAPKNSYVSLRSVVVVDPAFEAYSDLAEGVREGRLNLHIRSSGRDALRLAGKVQADAWIVAADLDDMTGADFIELLRDRLGIGASLSLNHPVDDARTASGTVQVLTGPVTCDELDALIDEALATPGSSGGVLARLFALPAVGIGIATAVIVVAMQAGG